MSIPNRPTLNDLSAMPVGDLAELSAETLALLQEDVDAAMRSAKAAKDRLDGAVTRKFSSRAAELRR
ncbi:MAG: hypothetical protein JJ898_21380, partial [Thalassospira sp.]|nr:hypothetical protein [Thalassospira sp.]